MPPSQSPPPLPDWPPHELGATGLRVGPCAWRLTMLAAHAEYVRAHPSLLVSGPDDDEATLRALAPRLADVPGLPLLISLREPAFARQLAQQVHDRLHWLGVARVDILCLWPGDVTELKGGRLLQGLHALRDHGMFAYLALAHRDIRMAEWLAQNTTARALLVPYGLANQSARFRALPAAAEYGMACLALRPDTPAAAPSEPIAQPHDAASLRFALAEAARALPVLAAPLPPDLSPLSPEEVEQHWQTYRATHPEPAPLPRAQPPE